MPGAEEETGHLVRALAHEFNNALHVVAGGLEALGDGLPPDEQDEIRRDASQAAQQAVRLVRLLHGLGRSLTPAPQQVAAAELLDQVVAEVEAAATPAVLPCCEPCGPLTVTGDPRVLVDSLAQLLLPLAGGPLYVTADLAEDEPGRWVVVEAIATDAPAATWAALAASVAAEVPGSRLTDLPVTISAWALRRLGARVRVDESRGRLQVYLPAD